MRTEYAYDQLGRLVRKWHRPSWTEEAVTNGTRVSVFDLMELRCAIDANRASLGLTTGGWTDEEIVAGRDVAVRAVHLTELRDRMQILWTTAGMGTLPEFSAGTIAAGTRSVKTSDPLDVRKWLEQYELSSYGQAHRARAYYEYDSYDGTTQFGRGRRTAVWDASGHQATYYDKLGRAYKSERWIDGHLYTSQATFDALSRAYQTTLPDNEVLSYTYGAHGLLTGMASSLGVSYVSGVGYNVLGQVRQYTLGTDPTTLASLRYYGLDVTGYPFGALKTIQLQKGASPMLVDREMSYDQAGNVTGVNDRVGGENISYSYDDLDRLTSAGSPVNETFSYSEIGNITARNSVPYTYGDPLHVHAVTAFDGTSYSYDRNGSLVTRAAQSVHYDAERRPVRVSQGASVLWRASYDGDGARRKRADAKGTIHYLGGYERNVGNGQDTAETITKYYRALGRLVAIRKNGILYWIGTDHLGGTVRVADSGFDPVGQMRYSPYGVSRDDPSLLPADYLFTDQQLDASIGLYWYGSRAYDQSLGRFTCADTVVPSAGAPQSLNRYSYALNNPLGYVDPSGHNPYDGLGIVEYDNPSYLPVEQRQALYEHNSDPSISNGSQGSVQVHESDDDGGGGGGGDPLAGVGIIDVRDWGVEPSYLPVQIRQLLYEHNTAISSRGGGEVLYGQLSDGEQPESIGQCEVPKATMQSPSPSIPYTPGPPWSPTGRPSDYGRVTVGVPVVSVTLAIDNYGQVFVSVGLGASLAPVSFSAAEGYVLGPSLPRPEDMDFFLTGRSKQTSVGLVQGLAVVDSGYKDSLPTMQSQEIGASTPDLSVDESYGIKVWGP